MIFVPHAGGKKARELGVRWGPMINEKHCLALDAAVFAHTLPRYDLSPVFGSSPYNLPLVPYESAEQVEKALTGDELLVIARPVAEGRSTNGLSLDGVSRLGGER